MSVHVISRELVAYQRRLEQLAKDNNNGAIQLAGEELTALIEELQSTNDELHSSNRELETAKYELEEKNHELTRLNTGLQNLVDNIDVAVLFVDKDLRIDRFTAAVTHIFPLQPNDRGRRLTDFVSTLRGVDFSGDLAVVLR
jgi:two-component system CheB/CheR fusion protein